LVIPLGFVVVAPGSVEPLGAFNTPHNAVGFLRNHSEATDATVLGYRMETPVTVHAPVRWLYVGGELLGPAGERRADMCGHLQVE